MSESEGPYKVEHSGSAGWWVVNTAGERLGWFSGKSDACKAVRIANDAHAAALASSKPSPAFVAMRTALEGLIEDAPTDDDLSDVALKPGQQIKLILTIDSARVRVARAAIALAEREAGHG